MSTSKRHFAVIIANLTMLQSVVAGVLATGRNSNGELVDFPTASYQSMVHFTGTAYNEFDSIVATLSPLGIPDTAVIHGSAFQNFTNTYLNMGLVGGEISSPDNPFANLVSLGLPAPAYNSRIWFGGWGSSDTHVQMLNLALWPDGSASSLFTKKIYQAKMTVGALYRTELAALLQSELGFAVRQHDNSFEIKGVSQQLIDRFSTRRAEIKSALKEHDATSSRAAEIAALATRKKKSYKPRAALAVEWQSVSQEFGFSAARIQALVGRHTHRIDPISVTANLVEVAVEKLSTYQSTFSEREVLRIVAEGGQLLGLTAHHAVSAATKAWQRHGLTVTGAAYLQSAIHLVG